MDGTRDVLTSDASQLLSKVRTSVDIHETLWTSRNDMSSTNGKRFCSHQRSLFTSPKSGGTAPPPLKKWGTAFTPTNPQFKHWWWCTSSRTCVSSALPIKKFHLKNPIWRTVDTHERPVLYHHEILQFVDFKMAAVRHLGILKLKFLTANISKTCCSLSR